MSRDLSIDMLRFVGLSCIILAHVNAPFWLHQLRCFDVPLMLFVSGLTSSHKSFPRYSDYILKRCKRLLIPTWSFLIIWFGANYCMDLVSDKPLMHWSYILKSFVMTGGLSYVWIIRVFLLITILTPLLLKIEKKVKSDRLLFAILLIIWGGTLEAFVGIEENFVNSKIVGNVIEEFVITPIAYSMFYILGIRMRFFALIKLLRMSIAFTLVWILALAIYFYTFGLPISIVPDFKYPPHAYYVCYGLFVCSWLWTSRNLLSKFLNIKLFLFIGRNTIWIYLYHIVLLSVPIAMHWFLEYLMVYGGAILLFYAQYRVYLKAKDKFAFFKYLVG